jgi:hypothetical protein
LCEVWPIHLGEKPGALVWRGDFVATPTLAFTKGTDRIVYGAILLQEIKKVVRCFQDDSKAMHQAGRSDCLRNSQVIPALGVW